MAIRYREDRKKFEADESLRGKRVRKLFKTQKEAKEFIRDVNLRKLNLDGLALPYPLHEAFSSFIETESSQKTARSARADRRLLRIVLHFFNKERGLTTVDEVGFEDLQHFQMWASKPQQCGSMSKGAWSDTTVARCSKLLKQVFRKLERLGRVKRNPTEFWKVPCGTGERRRPMNDSEFQALYERSREWFKPILMFMRLTGARGASIASMNWRDVDWLSKVVRLRSKKGGLKKEKIITLPLYDTLFSFLKDYERGLPVKPLLDAPVFMNEAGFPVTAATISAYGYTLIKDCGFDNLVLYSLRHAIAVDMTRAGISLETVRQGMGHSNIAQTSDYARGIALDSVAEAFDKIRKKVPPGDTSV